MGTPEFSGLKGRFFAWFLTSPMRRIIELKMGKPEDRILAMLGCKGDERLLDAGCGSGFHTLLLAERLPRGHVLAVDVSAEMLDRLRRQTEAQGLSHRVEILRGDVLNLPLADNSVDRALSAAVWHHTGDPQRACDELARVLRPGGRAVVSDLAISPGKTALRGIEGHDRAFGVDDMVRIMEAAGLVRVRIETVGRWILGAGEKPPTNPVPQA